MVEETEELTVLPATSWPVPEGLPLYVSVAEAAKLTGVSYSTMQAWAEQLIDPVPHIRVGRAKRLIRVSALPDYAKTKEVC